MATKKIQPEPVEETIEPPKRTHIAVDSVHHIGSLDDPELAEYPLGDDERGGYRRVPTSVGIVPARVGHYLSKGANGVHVHLSDPRKKG